MKETIIIITILVIIIGGDILENKYLKNSSQYLIEQLNNLKDKIKDESHDIKELKKEANKIYKEWKKTDEKWAMLILHSELDLIETSLIKMKTQITENNLDIALEELETSIFLINHISEKERFCLKNVF